MANLWEGLAKTRKALKERLGAVLGGNGAMSSQDLEDMEEALILADMGAGLASRLVEEIGRRGSGDATAFRQGLVGSLGRILACGDQSFRSDGSPSVVAVVGVNGSGKTTTIGKLTHCLQKEGKRVLLAAGDTFRAAAIEQLEAWGQRVGATVVKHQPGADPSAVIFDAIQAAKARGVDVVLADTAGRLHTRVNLMEELKKVKRVMGKAHAGSPHETLLVLDATTGQNALAQARAFHEALGLTGLVITKLDGSAKGGAVVGIVEEIQVPVKFLGVGEGLEDLEPFNPRAFAEALLG